MQITASFGDESVTVLLDANCHTLSAFRQTLQAALPLLDVEKMCLHLGQRLLDDESIAALCEGSVVTLSATLAARAADTLREEGCAVDTAGFVRALEAGDVRLCGLFLDARWHTSPLRPRCASQRPANTSRSASFCSTAVACRTAPTPTPPLCTAPPSLGTWRSASSYLITVVRKRPNTS